MWETDEDKIEFDVMLDERAALDEENGYKAEPAPVREEPKSSWPLDDDSDIPW